MTSAPLLLGIDELHALAGREFPHAARFGRIDSLRPGELVMALRAPEDPLHIRPGGTLSGPTLFTLADLAFWLLVLSAIGPVPLAVTTQLNLSFLRRARPAPVTARARLLKLGARLAVGDCSIESPLEDGPIAHAQITYSIPPPGKRAPLVES